MAETNDKGLNVVEESVVEENTAENIEIAAEIATVDEPKPTDRVIINRY